jgi:hypothetical protein
VAVIAPPATVAADMQRQVFGERRALLHRPAKPEGLFIKLTGHELRD